MSVSGHTERTCQTAGLQIDEDPQFQERMWRIERMGWWAIGVILLAATAGLFGHGLASRATVEITDPAREAGSLTLEFERFARAHSESQFIVSRPAGPPEGGTWSLWLSGNYLAGVEVLRITPDPASQEPVSDGVRYQYRIQDEPQTVIFRFKPERGGSLSGSLRVNDGPPTAFRQWLFP
jgi:hypothetical protein